MCLDIYVDLHRIQSGRTLTPDARGEKKLQNRDKDDSPLGENKPKT